MAGRPVKGNRIEKETRLGWPQNPVDRPAARARDLRSVDGGLFARCRGLFVHENKMIVASLPEAMQPPGVTVTGNLNRRSFKLNNSSEFWAAPGPGVNNSSCSLCPPGGAIRYNLSS